MNRYTTRAYEPDSAWREAGSRTRASGLVLCGRWPPVVTETASEQIRLPGGCIAGGRAYAGQVALRPWPDRRVRLIHAMPFVRRAGDLGHPCDECGRLDGAGGTGEADDPARDLVEVRDGDPILERTILQRGDTFFGMVRSVLDERCQRCVEMDDHLMQGSAAIHAPGLLKELVEVEPRPFDVRPSQRMEAPSSSR